MGDRMVYRLEVRTSAHAVSLLKKPTSRSAVTKIFRSMIALDIALSFCVSVSVCAFEVAQVHAYTIIHGEYDIEEGGLTECKRQGLLEPISRCNFALSEIRVVLSQPQASLTSRGRSCSTRASCLVETLVQISMISWCAEIF